MSKKIIALFKTIMKNNYLYDVISGNNIKH